MHASSVSIENGIVDVVVWTLVLLKSFGNFLYRECLIDITPFYMVLDVNQLKIILQYDMIRYGLEILDLFLKMQMVRQAEKCRCRDTSRSEKTGILKWWFCHNHLALRIIVFVRLTFFFLLFWNIIQFFVLLILLGEGWRPREAQDLILLALMSI